MEVHMEDGKGPHLELCAQAALSEERAQRALHNGPTVAPSRSQNKGHAAISVVRGSVPQEKVEPLRPRRWIPLA
jgi:hypothetical protein